MDKYEVTAKYNIAETCAASISISDLMSFSASPKSLDIINSAVKLTYGPISGSETLRSNLARLYSSSASKSFDPDNILITNGAIGANLIAFYALLGTGDHVICHYPTYQQLYEVPASLGAEVSLWRSKEDKAWALDICELESLIKSNTKMIIIKYTKPFRLDQFTTEFDD